MIKHVSFDVWNTLIASNPEYAHQRTEYLSKTFWLPYSSVSMIYTTTKQHIDQLAETEGKAFTTKECFVMLIGNILEKLYNKQYVPAYHNLLLNDMISNFNRLFIAHPPIIHKDAFHTLQELKYRDYTMNIASNSNFISGSVMSKFLREAFKVKFMFEVYSDSFGYAKPHVEFFSNVIRESGYKSPEILHVGDNLICDGMCQLQNFNFQWIPNLDRISTVLERL